MYYILPTSEVLKEFHDCRGYFTFYSNGIYDLIDNIILASNVEMDNIVNNVVSDYLSAIVPAIDDVPVLIIEVTVEALKESLDNIIMSIFKKPISINSMCVVDWIQDDIVLSNYWRDL